MACCSYNCLKQYIMYTGIISLLLGLGAVLYSFIMMEQQGENFTELEAYSSYNMFLLILLGLGAVLFFMGLFGICGGWKQYSCCITTFKICNIILAVLFLILGIVAVVFIYLIGNEIQEPEKCYDNFYFKATAKYDQLAQEMFCTSECPCYVESYSDLGIDQALITASSDEKDKRVQECEAFNKKTETTKGNFGGFLKTLENTFHCAGFCEKAEFYHYSDINQEVEKEQSCAQLIGEEIEENFFIYMIICFTIAFFMIVNTCVSRCVKNKQKERSSNYTEKVKGASAGAAVAGAVAN